MDQNLIDFEQHFVPLLNAAKERGLTYRVEQCPMPGWTTGDIFHNNIAYTPGTWIALHRLAAAAPRGPSLRVRDLALHVEPADQEVVAGVLEVLKYRARVLPHQDRVRRVVVDAEVITEPVLVADPVQRDP